MRESEARLREAQRIAHIGNWERDLLTNTLSWSEEIFGIFEIDRGHFAGSYEAFLAAIHPDDRARVSDSYARSLQARQPYEITYRILLPDRRIKHVQEDCITYYSPEGTPLRTVGTIQDITDRRRLEEQLRQSQKMEAIGQLAGGVAHDFNNILAATMMNLDLLREKPHLDPETRDALKELKTEAGRAAGLTRQLLMLSRRSVLKIRPLDLDELVANLLKMLGRLLGEHVTLAFERTTALPSVEADPGMLEQVLLNLTVNARDAMPRGGRIALATEAVEIDSERAASHPDRRQGQFVRLSVSDTGCGMDAGTLKRIFEPFFTTKEAGKGTGLGLAGLQGPRIGV
ncbi:MAG TPA: PAS domain-containing protein, partial [Spirochaetia bacterium]|nr:PAS domain-containing protein [Spirochaetia bacterium]